MIWCWEFCRNNDQLIQCCLLTETIDLVMALELAQEMEVVANNACEMQKNFQAIAGQFPKEVHTFNCKWNKFVACYKCGQSSSHYTFQTANCMESRISQKMCQSKKTWRAGEINKSYLTGLSHNSKTEVCSNIHYTILLVEAIINQYLWNWMQGQL